MKVEISKLLSGDRSLEIIPGDTREFHILRKAWDLHGYPRGYGKTITPNGMATGFFIPIGRDARRKNQYE